MAKRKIYVEPATHMQNVINTYSGVYSIYVIRHGIQEILQTCVSAEAAERAGVAWQLRLFKEKVYVEQIFCKHSTYKIVL